MIADLTASDIIAIIAAVSAAVTALVTTVVAAYLKIKSSMTEVKDTVHRVDELVNGQHTAVLAKLAELKGQTVEVIAAQAGIDVETAKRIKEAIVDPLPPPPPEVPHE